MKFLMSNSLLSHLNCANSLSANEPPTMRIRNGAPYFLNLLLMANTDFQLTMKDGIGIGTAI